MSNGNRRGGQPDRVSAAERRMQRNKKKRRNTYYLIILAAAVICFFVLAFTVFFNITTVKVEGSSNYTAEEIVEASGIKIGDNMLRENPKKRSESITSKLVYIENATVSRHFPSTVIITVEACIPHANVQTSDGYYLISRGGKILEKLTNPKTGLLIINGADSAAGLEPGDKFVSSDEDKTNDIYELIDAFDRFGLDNVTYIDISDRANVSFLYDSRITVELGVASDLDYKLKFAGEILTKEIGTGTMGTLRMLSDSAQFIDEAGLEENNRVYESNIASSAEVTEPPETDENGETITSSETETEAPAETSETETVTVATTME